MTLIKMHSFSQSTSLHEFWQTETVLLSETQTARRAKKHGFSPTQGSQGQSRTGWGVCFPLWKNEQLVSLLLATDAPPVTAPLSIFLSVCFSARTCSRALASLSQSLMGRRIIRPWSLKPIIKLCVLCMRDGEGGRDGGEQREEGGGERGGVGREKEEWREGGSGEGEGGLKWGGEGGERVGEGEKDGAERGTEERGERGRGDGRNRREGGGRERGRSGHRPWWTCVSYGQKGRENSADEPALQTGFCCHLCHHGIKT